MNIPRPEHPKPQFERQNWTNLNGIWQFEIDNGKSGIDRGLSSPDYKLKQKILVPFCPESELSGIGNTDFMYGVWYKRQITINEEQLKGRIFIHFGAVDYKATVFINSHKVGEHKGGYISFSFDITGFLTVGENIITVFAEDDTKSRDIPSGKQSDTYLSHGCFYTRTTGIWQTVWLEFTPKNYIKKVKYYPNYKTGEITIFADVEGKENLTVNVTYKGREMANYCAVNVTGTTQFTLNLAEIHLWEVGNGRLYDVDFSFGSDAVKSYFGLRNIELCGKKFLLNGKSIFQRTVLDQGFYPDGIYTAPSDEALKNDILLSLACGFNGARPHEKIFEERYFYHADKLGYLTWGEYPDWGLGFHSPTEDFSNANALKACLNEWVEEVERDFNHPSIIGWCPQNEAWAPTKNRPWEYLYAVTKALDPTRPCIDTSGGCHQKTDIFDWHNYSQVAEDLKKQYTAILNNTADGWVVNRQIPYDGKAPVFISEYGGIGWYDNCDSTTDHNTCWGYGNGPKSEEEFIKRFTELTEIIMNDENVMGLCYTQLTDVEQEQNGLHTYNRKPKFNPEIFKKVLSKKAAIED